MNRRLLGQILAPLLAAAVAIVVSSIALLIADESPITAFKAMWSNIDGTGAIILIVNRAVPYYVAGVAVAIGFKMNLFNIGAAGQYQLAALLAAGAGAAVSLWGPLHIAFVFVVAIVVGAAYAAIAGILKVWRGVNEVISTIMLNYIAIGISAFLLAEPLRNDLSGNLAATKSLPKSAHLPDLDRLFAAIGFHLPDGVSLRGFLPFAILIGVGYWLVLNRSRFGFNLRVSGANPAAARTAGVNPKRMILITIIISGAIAGTIGLAPLLTEEFNYGDQFPKSLGFTGIAIALLGRNHPVGVAAAALVWATIERATQPLSTIGIPQEIGVILQGSFLLATVIAYEVVKRWADAAEARAAAGRTPDVPMVETAIAETRGGDDMTVAMDTARPAATRRGLSRTTMTWLGVLTVVLVISAAREIADNPNLTSAGTFGVMVRTAAPIALAGLGGLFAERSGTVNIGLEGMMIMGTIFAGWWGWQGGPWMAILGGVIGGILGGLLHALATATFGVNHIVSGFAINIIAPGVARFMAGLLFVDATGAGIDGGSISNSPGISSPIGRFTLPILSGGDLFGWHSPDPLGWLEEKGWFVVSDIAGLLKGLTTGLTLDIILTAALFVVAGYLLWRTAFGLRLRSAGERPTAADSLGVPVIRYRYYGMIISGALAGLGGAVLVLFANRYQEGQTGGRGFLGLATLVVGNWRPAGVAFGAALFGYFQGITLRTSPEKLVLALLLVASIGLFVAAMLAIVRRQWIPVIGFVILAVACGWIYLIASRPNNQFVYITPYLVTLIVVSARGQALRPPAQAGLPWRKGMQV